MFDLALKVSVNIGFFPLSLKWQDTIVSPWFSNEGLMFLPRLRCVKKNEGLELIGEDLCWRKVKRTDEEGDLGLREWAHLVLVSPCAIAASPDLASESLNFVDLIYI